MKNIIILLFIITGYLSLHRLNNTYFWEDESFVGIFARNLLSTGQLTGWDGRNLYTYKNGTGLDNNLRTVNAPLDILVCAASFKLLGISTWSGRFPFVIIGLLGLGVFVLLIKHDFGEDKWLWLYTLSVFALSPVYLMNIRQCRYYALSLLFALLNYYAYRQYLSSKRIHYIFLLAGSSILAFYANPMLCAAFILALVVVHLIFHLHDFSIRDRERVGLAIILFLLGTAPYAAYYRVWDRPDLDLVIQEPWLLRHSLLTWWYLRDLNVTTYIPWTIGVGLIYLFLRYRQKDPVLRTALEWGLLAIFNVLFIAWISPQRTKNVTSSDVRYLIASLPFFIGMIGIFLWYVNRWSRLAGVALWIAILFSNIMTLTPYNQELHCFLPDYIYEIHHDYPNSVSSVVNYLKIHANQDDLVTCKIDSPSYPIMFYLGDKIKFCCGLDHATHLPHTVIQKLNAPLYIEENFPDWIVILGTYKYMPAMSKYFSRNHIEKGVNVHYTYAVKDILDVYWGDRTRPELSMHSFGPTKKYDKQTEAVYILKKEKVIE